MKNPDSRESRPALHVTDRRGLEDLCTRLRGAGQLALDTEFVGEHTFVPRLELIQVATPEIAAIVDVPAVGSLDPLVELFLDPAVEKVLHAARQDLEILALQCGRSPGPIFDTQLAAAMVGYGTQVAYAQLVQRIVGTRLAKSHTLTNWSQRPLSAEQLSYAVEDVLFLLPVHAHLEQRLRSLGRLEWAQEEFGRLTVRAEERHGDPRERYQRVRGWESLKPRSAAAFRELVAWREREAAARNVPRGRVMRDETLLELARQSPTSLAALRGMRGVSSGEVERHAEAVLDAIRQALALPESEWPRVERPRRTETDSAGQVELLQAVLKARAEQAHIAPTLLATSADLQALVEYHRERQGGDGGEVPPILEGWRRRLAGETLLQVLEGRVSVTLDPNSGKVRLSPPSATT